MKKNYLVEIDYLEFVDENGRRALFPKIFRLEVSCEEADLDLAVSDAIAFYLDGNIEEFEYNYIIINQN